MSAVCRNVSDGVRPLRHWQLTKDSEKLKAFIPLGIHNVSISPAPSAHVFAVLDTVSEADPKAVKEGLYGKDVMVWGGNCALCLRITRSKS